MWKILYAVIWFILNLNFWVLKHFSIKVNSELCFLISYGARQWRHSTSGTDVSSCSGTCASARLTWTRCRPSFCRRDRSGSPPSWQKDRSVPFPSWQEDRSVPFPSWQEDKVITPSGGTDSEPGPLMQEKQISADSKQGELVSSLPPPPSQPSARLTKQVSASPWQEGQVNIASREKVQVSGCQREG